MVRVDLDGDDEVRLLASSDEPTGGIRARSVHHRGGGEHVSRTCITGRDNDVDLITNLDLAVRRLPGLERDGHHPRWRDTARVADGGREQRFARLDRPCSD